VFSAREQNQVLKDDDVDNALDDLYYDAFSGQFQSLAGGGATRTIFFMKLSRNPTGETDKTDPLLPVLKFSNARFGFDVIIFVSIT